MGFSFQGDGELTAAIGNYFSLVGWNVSGEEDTRIHFGVEGAGYFGLRAVDRRFPLDTTDGLVGGYLEGNRGPFQVQFRYTHISAHLSDGVPSGLPIVYSREFTALRIGFAPDPYKDFYAGMDYVIHSAPRVPRWALQWGMSLFLPWNFLKVVPFTAVDFKWRQESFYNPSMNFELGVALNNAIEAYRSFRLFYAFYTGADPRGQFYQLPFTSNSIGIEMQI
jgi:Protein of unknown function (DUF1207)